MIESIKRALVLAPHTDDGEIGCGGTIAKLAAKGCDVHYAAFSTCGASLPAGFPPGTLEKEVREATLRLGIRPENLRIYNYPVRRFRTHSQDILEDLVALNKLICPDVVFAPSQNDIHQDHSTIAEEAIRAYKNKTILAYEMPWNNLIFETRGFSILSLEDINKKMYALEAYESQKGREYFKAEFLKNLAAVRGAQVKTQYAEVFDVVRHIF